MAGKGSAPRKGRDDKKYAASWDAIFGNKTGQEARIKGDYGEFMAWLDSCPYDFEVELDEETRVNVTFHL